MSAAPEPGRFCPVHPSAPAATVCARCGRFCCLDCAAPRVQLWYCAECSRRVDEESSGSWFAIIAALSAFVGLGCAPFAVLAVVLAGTDLARMSAGRSPKGGLKLDVFALVAAVAGLVLGAFMLQRLSQS